MRRASTNMSNTAPTAPMPAMSDAKSGSFDAEYVSTPAYASADPLASVRRARFVRNA